MNPNTDGALQWCVYGIKIILLHPQKSYSMFIDICQQVDRKCQ